MVPLICYCGLAKGTPLDASVFFLTNCVNRAIMCRYAETIHSEVDFMFWKMINVQLQKGSIFPWYGDSAPFFKLDGQKQTEI